MSSTELPAGWAWATLGEICLPVATVTGGRFATSRFRYIDIGSVDRAARRIETADLIDATSAPSRARQIVRANDTLYSTVRPYLRKLARVTPDLDGQIASTGFTVLRPHTSLDHRYVFYATQSSGFESQLFPKQRGASYPAVRDSDVFETRIPLPPLAEQHRIVEALEDHLSRLEAAVQSVARAHKRSKPLASAILNHAALGGPTVQPTCDAESLRKLAGRASQRFDYAALPTLPQGWFWRRSDEVCTSITSGSTPKGHLMHADEGDIPFLKVYNITQDGRVDFSVKPTFVDRATHEGQLRRSRVSPGDVLTNIVGPPLGKTAVVPDQHTEWNINQAIVAFRAGPEVHSPWLEIVLRSPIVLGLLQATAKATAGQFNVALSTCRELPLPVPPLARQRAIIDQCKEQLDQAERVAAQTAHAAQRANHLRQSLLTYAFAGRLVPQSPGDEPATVLLDRIRAERQAQSTPKAKRTRKAVPKQAPPGPPPPREANPLPTDAVQQELPL